MPEIIKTTVYYLDELSDAARDKARIWYRDQGFDCDWYDAVFEDFKAICDILGLEVKTRPVRTIGGKERSTSCIYFRGFWSQGDGACFEAIYRYAKRAPKNIRAYAPDDKKLHEIAQTLQDVQKRNFYQLRAVTCHGGNYYHEYCMDVSVERESPNWQEMTDDADDGLREGFRDLARWLYRQLEKEYEFLTSDDAVDEMIAVNEYTFTENGHRFG